MSTRHQFEKPAEISAEQADSVRSALEQVISSDAFAGSKRCQDFLSLVVEHALAGELDALRERMIGVEMFGRPADYDTSNDAVVSVRATEVRKRLAQYYSEAATTPVVRIELPPGSYVPEFHWSSAPEGKDKIIKTRPPRTITPGLRRMSVVAIAAALGIACLVLVVWRLQRRTEPQSVNAVHLSLGLPEAVNLHRNWHPFEQIALSPDGQMLAFAATDASGKTSLWIRALSSSEAQRIEQTEGALLPFWSPDSQSVGFWADSKLKKVRWQGGVPEVI